MASDPPKRSDDETEAETVKRRLIDAVRERIDEMGGVVGNGREPATADGAQSEILEAF
jgi:hypothetical protein